MQSYPGSEQRRRSPRSTILAALVIGLAASGCSSGDDGSGADGGAESSTVEHVFGSTTIEGVPERIVSLNTQWTSTLLALGVQPVGYSRDSTAPNGAFPWEVELSPEAEVIDITDGVSLEQVAALRPDLILVTYLASEESVYDDLASIAPTIPALTERQVDTWQQITTTAGEFLQMPEAASDFVAEVEAEIDSVAAELPGLTGKTFLLSQYIVGDQLGVVADPEDGASLLFQRMGMSLYPPVVAEADGPGRLFVSTERLDLLASEFLVLFINGGTGNPSADMPGYDTLPSVQAGSCAMLGLDDVIALNTPSGLSISYILEILLPQLEAVAT